MLQTLTLQDIQAAMKDEQLSDIFIEKFDELLNALVWQPEDAKREAWLKQVSERYLCDHPTVEDAKNCPITNLENAWFDVACKSAWVGFLCGIFYMTNPFLKVCTE